MLSKLSILELRVFGYHGCMDEESVVGTQFTVNAHIWYNIADAALSDQLEHAIDYGAISELITKEVKQRNQLIETVAMRVLNKIKAYNSIIEKVELELIKHAPPINANVRSVAITLIA